MDALPPFGGPLDKPAIIMGSSGEVVTHGELTTQYNRVVHFLRDVGLRAGDTVAACLENSPAFLYVAIAAMRSGLVFVPVSSWLTAAEIAYIVHDSGARVLVTSPAIGPAFAAMPAVLAGEVALITTGPAHPGYRSWLEIAALPDTPITDVRPGGELLYSSGTTGTSKGIRYQPISGRNVSLPESILEACARMGIGGEDVYLCPAPLYHSAPMPGRWRYCAWAAQYW